MIKSILFSIIDTIKGIFLNGLLITLPITLTLALFIFLFKILKGWLAPIYKLEPLYLQQIPHSEILVVICFIFIIGAIFRFFFLKTFHAILESALLKIPLLNPVYSGIKQLVQAFTMPEKLTFKKVVLVEFPRNGIYSIGFLTSEVPAALAPQADKKFYKIFIPTTPNPTTGFLISVPEGEFKVIDLNRQEAMSLIISGGIVQPERFSKK